MLASITGIPTHLRENFAIIEANNIGYKVFVSSFFMGKLASGKEIHMFLYTHVREQEISLYGFESLAELEMFELLISVSGIGPKAGLAILSIADTRTIQTAILNNDVSILTRVSGVGKKTAERVVLELQNKVGDLPDDIKEKTAGDGEVLEALESLGYTPSEVREVVQTIPKDMEEVSEKIKYVLKNLGK